MTTPPPERSLSIPSGAAATTAWKNLDAATRKHLMSGTPAADPMAALVAVGYARTVLSRSRWRYLAIRLGLYIVLVFGLTLLEVSVFHTHNPLPRYLAIAALIGLLLYWRRRRTALLKMEIANAAVLWPVDKAQEVPETREAPEAQDRAPEIPDTTYSATVRYRRTPILVGWGFVILLWLITITAQSPASIFTGVLGGIFTVLMVLNFLNGARPGAIALHMDASGVTAPALGISLPWPEITELRIVPNQNANGTITRQRDFVAFVPADPQAAVAGLRGRRARMGRNLIKAYGSPLALTDRMVDSTIEDILGDARRFTKAPVRAYGQPVQ